MGLPQHMTLVEEAGDRQTRESGPCEIGLETSERHPNFEAVRRAVYALRAHVRASDAELLEWRTRGAS